MLADAGVALVERARVVAAAARAPPANPKPGGASADAPARAAALASVTAADGRTFSARVFVDATYAGDVLPLANVSFAVGREGAAQYGEPLAGVRGVAKGHEFARRDSAESLLFFGSNARPSALHGCPDAHSR